MIGRFVRTASRLHPLQVAARGPHAVLGRVIRDVPASGAPRVVGTWPEAPEAMRKLAGAERARGVGRLEHLPPGRLRDYEACYGLELGADADVPPASWSSRVAIEPYPASVRARRIAVAMRCGRRGLEGELARAARAVLVRPELHLLGNHVLENGFALACAGAVARGPEADLWWAAGCRLLRWQLGAQFVADGGHIERSASYHLALTAALLETIELSDAGGRATPTLWRDVASTALGWMAAVRAPDGTYPLFNDAAFDAAPNAQDVLALGQAVGVAPWRVERLDATGWVRLEAGPACVFIDAGPDAEGWQPGHAHADGLSFELWVDARRVVVDHGVASYEPGPARDETRATRAHNTVELGGADSCEVWGAFRVGRRGRGRVLSCELRDGGARVELDHDGYAWLPGAPRHVRTFGLHSRGLEVRDRVPGAGANAWTSRLRLDAQAAGRVRVTGEGPIERSEGVWYPRHGQPLPAVCLEQRAKPGHARDVVWRVEW